MDYVGLGTRVLMGPGTVDRVADEVRALGGSRVMLLTGRRTGQTRLVARAKADGGHVLVGGRRLTDGELAHGHFVAPTLIDGLPPTHALFREELFVPITALCDVATLDDASARELIDAPLRWFNGRDNAWLTAPAEVRHL